MPITYTIDHQQNLLRTTGIGNLTLNEVLAHFRELARDPDYVPGIDVLLDLREMTSVPSSNQIKETAAFLERPSINLRFGRCAIVASRDVLYGFMRIFQVLAQNAFASIRVFRDLGDAERWLYATSSEE